MKFGWFIVFMAVFHNTACCQSLIKGSVYFFDSNIEAPGCTIIIIDSTKSESIIGTVSDLYGDFKLSDAKGKIIDLEISYVGYRNTVVKNINLMTDTVYLYNLPLFIYDAVLNETLVKPVRNFLGFKKKGVLEMIHNTIGEEGPFTNERELMIIYESTDSCKIRCKKKGFDIEIDYSELQKCEYPHSVK